MSLVYKKPFLGYLEVEIILGIISPIRPHGLGSWKTVVVRVFKTGKMPVAVFRVTVAIPHVLDS